MFYVGQKVVCVDDGPSGFTGRANRVLTKGQIYTVSKSWEHAYRGAPVVLLAEVDPDKPYHECFSAARFRPVVDRKTDISIFTAMLNTKPVEVDA